MEDAARKFPPTLYAAFVYEDDDEQGDMEVNRDPMMLVPTFQRQAMIAVYAFSHMVKATTHCDLEPAPQGVTQ